MCLPLIEDGRIAWPYLLRDTDRAWVQEYGERPRGSRGRALLQDGNLFWVWPDQADQGLPRIKLLGTRLQVGDTIGLRPIGGTLTLYRVARHLPTDDDWSEDQASPA